MTDYTYDLEVLSNIFICVMKNCTLGKNRVFEVSRRRNDFPKLIGQLRKMQNDGSRMVGFNNLQYDYIILHHLMMTVPISASWREVCKEAKTKNDEIFRKEESEKARRDKMFRLTIWNPLIPQIDLLKIHHFDNKAKMTSLKEMEFNMQSSSVQDLPFDPDEPLPKDQFDNAIHYCEHDVNETDKFRILSADQIRFREELTKKYDKNFLCANDTKIGKQFFTIRLEEKLGRGFCEHYDSNGQKVMRQTERGLIDLAGVVLPEIEFEPLSKLNVLLDFLLSQSIHGKDLRAGFKKISVKENQELAKVCDPCSIVTPKLTKKQKDEDRTEPDPPYIKELNVKLNDMTFYVGAGGLHGCVLPGLVRANKQYTIIDVDVDGYYPSLSVAYRLYPEHLTDEFCNVAAALKQERKQFPKGTAENKSYKLANNGTYGNSNSDFTAFYDPKYTLKTTINGQLLLLRLAELFYKIPGLRLIQANTDGLTTYCPRDRVGDLKDACLQWEFETGLTLEETVYSRMWVRDVNNYIAEFQSDKPDKLKGCYPYDYANEGDQWHKDFSFLVIKKVVHQHVKTGRDIEELLREHPIKHDFCGRAKIQRSHTLLLRDDQGRDLKQQNIVRYYVSNAGGHLIKQMPPLARTPDKIRYTALQKGQRVTIVNEFHEDMEMDIDYKWYVKEVEKLTAPFNRVLFEGEDDDNDKKRKTQETNRTTN